MSRVCAIHQPDFFPWLGVFDKIKKADVFVFLDDAQIVKTGSSYSNRVMLNYGGQAKYFTAPIKREPGYRNINQVQFANDLWREKFKKTLQANYGKSSNFNELKTFVWRLVNFNSSFLVNFNVNAIVEIARLLNIADEEKFVLSSSLACETTSEERILDICEKVNCDTYYSGQGAKAYQDDQNFTSRGIHLAYQEFDHPTYPQSKSEQFMKGLSVLDCLFEKGSCF